MALNQRLDIRQSQSLVMTPQLQQAIKLLQLSNIELNEYVEEQLVENPLLERNAGDDADPQQSPDSETIPAIGDTTDVVREDGSFDQSMEAVDADFANVWDDGSGGSESGILWSDGGGAPLNRPETLGWEAFATKPISLHEHLLSQAGLEFPDPHEHRIAVAIVDQLDEAGYFVGNFADLAYLTGSDTETVEWVHSQVLKFEPVGIGARSLSEALSLQLREHGALSKPMSVLLENLELVASRDFKQLCRLCKVDAAGLGKLINKLQHCAPRPAAGYDTDSSISVVPDVLVRSDSHSGWVIELNPDALPQVLANRDYYGFVRKNITKQADIEFLTGQWQAANWLVKALEQRANTILKVTSCIVKNQQGFLESGVSALRPMTLMDIANEVGVHESTVSRVTSGKYMETPRGVFELKYFFTASLGAVQGTDGQSVEAVRLRLRQLIEGETVQHVLSDEDLVTLLKGEGVKVARRTVAKYREAMNIPSSAQRRRMLRFAAG